jgi:hypothetical protein
MRKLRQLSIAVLLALIISAPTFAGIIGTPPEPTPEPQAAAATGITDTPPSAAPANLATDPVVNVALNLLQSVLSLF